MQRSLKFIFSLVILAGIFMTARLPFVFSQEEGESAFTKMLSGEVVSVDSKNSAIDIKQLKDEEALTYETITIYADNSTSIERDYETVILKEIKAGDEVTVEYTSDETGKNIASAIWANPKE